MPQDNGLGRREFLSTAGAGTALALAGCLGRGQAQPSKTTTASNSEGGLESAKSPDISRIAADPTNVPAPIERDSPRHHELSMTTTEVTAEIEPGVTFDYMTFEEQIPGPMVRARVGDTIEFTLTNASESAMPHNVDFHATYGPGGGAEDTTVAPGESATIEFKVMYPGVHIYHCAVPNMDYHISSGMFGAILVEPKDGLPEVDRELYFGQHELYTDGSVGEEGHHGFDFEAMREEHPTYVALNGEASPFTEDNYGPVTVDKGDRVRIYWANGGPNLTSSWHAIGNTWSKLYRNGDLVSPPARYVETTSVPPGSVSAAEIETPVPGPIKLVDHALSRVVHKGMLGVIQVEGTEDTEIYNANP